MSNAADAVNGRSLLESPSDSAGNRAILDLPCLRATLHYSLTQRPLAPRFSDIGRCRVIEFNPSAFFQIARMLGGLERSLFNDDMLATNDVKDGMIFPLAGLKENVDKFGMQLTSSHIARFQDRLKDECTLGALRANFTQLLDRMQDELASGIFLMVARSKQDYFTQPDLFGQEVASKFRDANVDIAEAGKCFASGRHTACVFHLMRVMEVGLVRLAKRFKVATNSTWGTMIRKIDGVLEPRRKDPKRKKAAVRFDAAIAHLRSAKDGWRDRVSHSNIAYTENQAKTIFSAVEGFMMTLASLL